MQCAGRCLLTPFLAASTRVARARFAIVLPGQGPWSCTRPSGSHPGWTAGGLAPSPVSGAMRGASDSSGPIGFNYPDGRVRTDRRPDISKLSERSETLPCRDLRSMRPIVRCWRGLFYPRIFAWSPSFQGGEAEPGIPFVPVLEGNGIPGSRCASPGMTGVKTTPPPRPGAVVLPRRPRKSSPPSFRGSRRLSPESRFQAQRIT